GKAFISGEEGTIISGPTPQTLTVRTLATTDWFEGIAASSNMVVVAGDNGTIYSSSNGTEWDRRGNFSTWLRGVAYGADQFVTVGEDGFIAISPDGVTWQERASGTTSHLNRVTWLNDRFWIIGDEGTVLTNTSADSFALVNTGITNTLFTASANSNEVVLAGDGIVLMGPSDGSNWVLQSDPLSPLLAPIWPYYSSIWDGRLFLLSGQTGMLVEGFRTNATAPLHWYSTIQPTRSWLWSVARPADFFVAVGANGTITTSEDGVEWFREATPPGTLREVFLGVGGNNDILLTVGSSGSILRSVDLLTNIVSTNITGELLTNLVSLFGVNWENITGGGTNDLQGVAVKDDIAIVTGANGTILTSIGPALGTIWLPQISGVSSFLSGATVGPQGFVVVGDDGVILTSDTGLIWTRRNSGVESWIYAVRYVGGQYIAVGEEGLILTSSDGNNWERRESNTTEWLNDVTFLQGTWYITASRGLLVTSIDGVQWTVERSITAKSLYGAATDGEQIIVAGMEGVILRRNLEAQTSPVNIEEYAVAGLSSIFLFTGKVDQQFVLEASTSPLGPWRSAAYLELTEPGGTILFELPLDDSDTKFYRTRLL
ncbi:MAG TPA: hypothetical protein VFG14_18435, partial [Chthoniobacteraceae bacterium]|nr:hypothetical protein [Chthoniobacteraceae bacterium]